MRLAGLRRTLSDARRLTPCSPITRYKATGFGENRCAHLDGFPAGLRAWPLREKLARLFETANSKRSVPAYRACYAERHNAFRFAIFTPKQRRTKAGRFLEVSASMAEAKYPGAERSPHSHSIPKIGPVLQDQKRGPV